jgi:hypothetical protein
MKESDRLTHLNVPAALGGGVIQIHWLCKQTIDQNRKKANVSAAGNSMLRCRHELMIETQHASSR